MPFVDANGVRLHVVGLGSEGPQVAMLHGLLLGNLATWYFGAGADLATDHRVLLHDLRGHGRSEVPPDGYDVATHAADLDARLPDGPVALVGHSFGGLVALHWALAHPDRVTHLVLVDTPLPPTAPAEIATFVQQDPAAMVDALPDGLKEAVASGRRQARKLVAHLVQLATQTTLLTDLTAAEAPDDQALAALNVPTALIYGADSSCRASGEHLAATLPHATLVTLPGGHYLHLDAPDALSAAIRAHLTA